MGKVILLWGFDGLLGITLVWLAWLTLSRDDLFKSIVLFIIFGLVLALTWVRLEAPDVALAEAAIGAGITGALLLGALARLESTPSDGSDPAREKESLESGIPSGRNSPNKLSGIIEMSNQQNMPRIFLVILLSVMGAGLAYSVLSLPTEAPGLSERVTDNIDVSGVENPVTAVVLNFRGYDTLLEMAVLLLALLVVWSLGPVPQRREVAPGEVLDYLTRLLVPLLILVAGYLLWVGAIAPGGAFQAGSVLAAAGLLLLLSDWRFSTRFTGLSLRLPIVGGLAVFVLAGLAMMLDGGRFLEYPVAYAGTLILVIEVAATLSIGLILIELFLGGRPSQCQSPGAQIESKTEK